MIDINNLEIDTRNTFILFATHDFIIYREKNKVVLASCNEEKLSEVVVAGDCTRYQCADLGDAVLFVFNGTDIVIIDKSGMMPIQHVIDPLKIGRCVTEVYPWQDNQIVFGTRQMSRTQFLTYDFIEQKRIAQTASWEIGSVTDTYFDRQTGTLYAVLDNSIIVAHDVRTGEKIWTKFETAKINPGILMYDGDLFYTCQGLLKRTDGNEISSIRIPAVKACSVEWTHGRNIYFTSNENKNLCCYNVESQKLKWEIHGQQAIKESAHVKGTDKADILFVRTQDYVGIINLTTGKSESAIRTRGITKLCKTDDHLLIQKTSNETVLVPEVREKDYVGNDTI